MVDGLEKRLINNKLVVYFNSLVDNLLREQYTNSTVYLKSLRDVVTCARNSMRKFENTFQNSFSSNCQTSTVPIELLSLISMLIDGVTITNEVFNQAALTSAQQFMFNFRINQSKDMDNFRRHLQFRETPVAIYTTLKLCVDKIKNTY